MKTYWVELLGAQVYRVRGRYMTRVIEAGKGEPLLLLHGTGGHAENYARNIIPLSQHFRVLAIDLLWHGASQTTGFDPAIIPPMVDQVLDVMDTLDIRRTHLEGQSLGGWVAMHVAMRYPERVGKLILTTTQGYRPDDGTVPGYAEPDPRKSRTHSLNVLAEPTFEAVRSRLARVLAHPDRLPDEAVAVRHRFYNDPALNAVQQQFVAHYPDGQALSQHLITDLEARTIRTPTLVYWGDKNVTPPALGQRLAQVIPSGRFYSAAETGHWAQFESHESHNREVARFLGAA